MIGFASRSTPPIVLHVSRLGDIVLGASIAWLRSREFARAFLPPALYGALRRLRDRFLTHAPEWEYVPEGWARGEVKGWNVAAMAERHRLLWPEWKRALSGTGTLGVDFWRSLRSYDYDARVVPADLPWAHNAVISYGYALALTARHRDRLSVLDWGGGIGQFLPLTKALLPGVAINYHVKEVPTLCSLGRELNPEAYFHEDDSWQERRYDLVLSSAAFHLQEPWRETLRALAKVASRHLCLIRLPIVFHHPSFVVLQRADTYGFETQFLGWFLNRDELLGCANDAGLELVREFVMLDQTPAYGAPEQATYRGFLFRPGVAVSGE